MRSDVISGMTQASLIILTRAEAERAIAAGARRLHSPPDAAQIWGVLWFAGLQAEIDAAHPAPADRADIALDCGDRADLALEALRLGIRVVVFSGSATQRAKLTEIAAAQGGEILGADSLAAHAAGASESG